MEAGACNRSLERKKLGAQVADGIEARWPRVGYRVKNTTRKRSGPEAGSKVGESNVARRGRRSMPAVREARQQFTAAQRRVAMLEKQLRQGDVDIVLATSKKDSAELRRQQKAVRSLLKQAQKILKQSVQSLRSTLLEEAAKSRELAQHRALARYEARLSSKMERDLAKAVGVFTALWRKRRSKIVSRKLKARARREAQKALAARRKANAKARASVKRAEALAKARARKAASKARIKAKKLAVRVVVKARLAVRKAARKARLAEVKAGRVSRHQRSQ